MTANLFPKSLMSPPIEDLLDKVDSKFSLVTLGARRARQINAYKAHLGGNLGAIVPPQLDSISEKPLSIAFEEIAESLVQPIRDEPSANELSFLESDEALDDFELTNDPLAIEEIDDLTSSD